MNMTAGRRTLRAALLKAASVASLTAAGLGLAQPANAIVINNNFTPTQAVDTAGGVNGVGAIISDEGGGFIGICTGTLINPRTVIFAAHCVNDKAASAYGVGGTAIGAFFNVSALPAIQAWYGGARQTNIANAAYTINQIAYDSRSVPNGFLEADIALGTLDTPAASIPTWALLFSPLPVPGSIGVVNGTGYHVNITGYGNNGTAATGSTGGIDFRRRAAENMIGALASLQETEQFLFGGAPNGLPQNLYHIDFDDPANTSIYDFNYFLDDARTREGMTAAGDSGGPLILDAANNAISTRNLVIGVLSGGYTRFYAGAPANGYGTGAFYQPLYLYWDYIAANNPYRYVTAAAGNGNWEDATRWQTTLDPNYYVISGSTAVNGTPTSPGAGPAGNEPNFGKECFESGNTRECRDVNTNVETIGPRTPTDGSAAVSNVGKVNIADLIRELSGGTATADLSSNVGQANLADVTPDLAAAGAGLIDAVSPEPQLVYGAGPLPTPTLVNGLPGATNFTPNNVAPTAGGTKARYFDVTLSAAGITTLSSTVTIDRLAVRNTAGLTVATGATLNSLIDVAQAGSGTVTVNGRLTSVGDYTLTAGLLQGSGSIKAPFLTSIMGAIAPGTATTSTSAGTVGTLTVEGSVVMASASGFLVDVASSTSADRLTVTGGALNLGGTFQASTLTGFVSTFGQSWTVASATGGITGSFSTIATNFNTSGVLRSQLATVGTNLILSITAVPYSGAATYTSPEQREIARAFDLIRASGAQLPLFTSTDQVSAALLPATLEALSPLNAFAATGLTEASSSLIADSIVDRGDQLASGGGHGFQTAGLEMLGIGPQLASADPYDAMMMGAAAVVAAQEQAAETASTMASIKLKEGFGVFLDISGLVNGSYDVTPFAGEADLTGVNGTLGFDYSFADDQAFIGGALSYQTGDAKLATPLQSVEADSLGINVYGGVREGDSFFTGYLGFSAQAYDLSRTVVLPGGNQTLIAQPDGSTWVAGAKAGLDFDVGNGTITPHVGLDAMWITVDGYTEQGGSAAYIMPDRDTTLIDGRIGLTYKGLFDMGEGSALRPKLSVAYVIDVQSDDNVLSTAFLGFPPTALTFVGSERDSGWAEYEVGMEYEGSNFGLALSYTGADNGALTYGVVAGRLSLAW
ncbi:hypothetical protein sos41_05820 [Alphaproteobacteria bacterium SO-S41]|nr:hypothetical protein sos41_05820 [Alphaproteobacteria bacterium SO-S41]